MQRVSKKKDLEKEIANLKKSGRIIGFVPTMGALHRGHLSLIKECKRKCDVSVVSIYVNPTQFNDKSDFRNYPRDTDTDITKLESVGGVDIVYTPISEELYPDESLLDFDLGYFDTVMEGANRRGHFKGVITVVDKLFSIVKPDFAFFGEKDYQQLAIIKHMSKALHKEIKIIPCPTLREDSGLAMSSRNELLSKEERAEAANIYQSLKLAVDNVASFNSIAEIKKDIISKIDSFKHLETEYFEIADKDSLKTTMSMDALTQSRAFIAVRCGKVRLIDNIPFK
ncbi:MAG: pantoate--beta-alanine ligase [Bacteroidales bacterium]